MTERFKVSQLLDHLPLCLPLSPCKDELRLSNGRALKAARLCTLFDGASDLSKYLNARSVKPERYPEKAEWMGILRNSEISPLVVLGLVCMVNPTILRDRWILSPRFDKC